MLDTPVELVVRDALFYTEDSATEIWNLGEVAKTVLATVGVEIMQEQLGDDTVILLVSLGNLYKLRECYTWEIINEDFIVVYLDGIICGSDASRVEMSWSRYVDGA